MSRPASTAFVTEVTRIQALSPSFRRITVAGETLAHFDPSGFDQRIKLLLPLADGTITDIGLFDEPAPTIAEWYGRWRLLPDEQRNPMRTYTARAIRPAAAELDIDFVLHGGEGVPSGPASAWAEHAEVGDSLTIIGPDARSTEPGGGIEWRPGTALRVLLAGDETAAPAICAILEQLDESFSGEAFIEVPSPEDMLEVKAPSGIRVHWLPRTEDPAPGSALSPAIRDWAGRRGNGTGAPRPGFSDVDPDELLWEAPEAHGEEYAWLAGESGVITGLRRHLVKDIGMDRRSIAFMGYWRIGRAEGA